MRVLHVYNMTQHMAILHSTWDIKEHLKRSSVCTILLCASVFFYLFKHLQHAWMHEHKKTKTVSRVELKKWKYQTKLKPANPTPLFLAVTQTQTHFLPLYLDSCPLCCALVFDLWFNAPFPLETLAHSGAKLQKKEREW